MEEVLRVLATRQGMHLGGVLSQQGVPCGIVTLSAKPHVARRECLQEQGRCAQIQGGLAMLYR